MVRRLKSLARFVISLVVMTVACTIIWQEFVAERLYDCSDDHMLRFLRPGDWVHHPVAAHRVVPARTMSEPDTIKEGWNVTGLWCLWSLFFAVSLVVSIGLARVRWVRK